MRKVYKMSGSSNTEIHVSPREFLDTKTLHKMEFIINAIDKGWSVKKRNDSYIFSKKHEGRREILKDTYLESFIKEML